MRRKKAKTSRSPRTGVLELLGAGARELCEAQATVRFNCSTGAVEIDNCRGILVYDTQKIKLDMGENCVQIEGDDLMMDTYQKDRITIHGRLFAVRLCYEKGES